MAGVTDLSMLSAGFLLAVMVAWAGSEVTGPPPKVALPVAWLVT